MILWVEGRLCEELLLASCLLSSGFMAPLPGRHRVLSFQVLRDYKASPSECSVVMHPVQKNGQQSKGGLQNQNRCRRKGHLRRRALWQVAAQVLAPGSKLLERTTMSTNLR